MEVSDKFSVEETIIDEALDEFKDFYAQIEVPKDSLNNFSKSQIDDVSVISVNLSRATLAQALELKKIIDEEIKSGIKKLVINLSQCELIDTTFLGTLVISLRNIRENEGELKLVEPITSNKNLMLVTNTFKLFDFYKSQEEAVKSF